MSRRDTDSGERDDSGTARLPEEQLETWTDMLRRLLQAGDMLPRLLDLPATPVS
jgi:hypothetical protein